MYRNITEAEVDVRTREGMTFARKSIEYVMGILPAFTLQHAIKSDLVTMSAKDFRLKLLEDGYNVTRFKFAALYISLKPYSKERVRSTAKKFKLRRNDVVLLIKAFSSRNWRSNVRHAVQDKGLTPEMCSYEAYRKAQKELDSIIKDITPTVKSIVHNKLRFLVNCENLEYGDFHNELFCKAVAAYYIETPTVKERAHVANTLRRACHNHALNIINARTSQKRQRMVNTGTDGFGSYKFELTVTSENQLAANADGDVLNYEELAGGDNSSGKLLDDVNYVMVVRKLGITPKRKKLIEIISGEFCPQFTDYLQVTGKLRHDKDNTDFIETASTKSILETVSKYYNVKINRLQRFYQTLGNELLQGRYV